MHKDNDHYRQQTRKRVEQERKKGNAHKTPHEHMMDIAAQPLDGHKTSIEAALQTDCHRELSALGLQEVFGDRDFQKKGLALLKMIRSFDDADKNTLTPEDRKALAGAMIVIDGLAQAHKLPDKTKEDLKELFRHFNESVKGPKFSEHGVAH